MKYLHMITYAANEFVEKNTIKTIHNTPKPQQQKTQQNETLLRSET